MDPSHSQTADNTSWVYIAKAMSFFPLKKLIGTQPTKTPAVWVANLEEESNNKNKVLRIKTPVASKA